MARLLDRFYTLTDEELYYRKLYEEGRDSVRYINLPEEVEESARAQEKIILSSSYYSRSADEEVIVLKHPCYMPRYLHSHRFVEMTYVLSGSVEESIEGQDLIAKRGDVVILMPGFYHSIWTDDERTVAVNILLDRDFFAILDERFGLGLRDKCFEIYSGVDISDQIEDMLRQDVVCDMLSPGFKAVIAQRALLEMRRQGVLSQSAGIGMRKEVFRIMSYLDEHSHEVTLTSFADHFGITEQYASRLIKEKTGMSFSQIVRKLRMEEAASLLKKGQLSSKEIAYTIGYSSPEHFSRTFKGYYGTSPDLWRKENLSV